MSVNKLLQPQIWEIITLFRVNTSKNIIKSRNPSLLYKVITIIASTTKKREY